MQSKANSTKNFYVHLIDRSRHCNCDCRTLHHQHSLIDSHAKEYQEQQQSPSCLLPSSPGSSSGQTIVIPENYSAQVALTPTSPSSLSSPALALPTDQGYHQAKEFVINSRSKTDITFHPSLATLRCPVESSSVPPEDHRVVSSPSPAFSRSFCQGYRKFFGTIKKTLHLDTYLPGRLRRSSMAMFRRPFEAVELDSPTVFEMPASQPVELECPDATEPPGLSVSSNRQPSGMQTDLNEMGSWSNICDMPAELPELHPPSYGSFAQGPEVVKEPVEKPALYLGGADDFQGSAASGSFQPFFHSTQRATPGPERAVEPLSTCYPRSITFPDTLLTNAITSPTPTYQTPSGYLIRERSPRLPILKLNTVNIQGKYLSPASSRRPSVQSGTSGDSSPWSLTQASTATPQSSNPSSGMRSSSQSFHYAAAHWSPDYLQPYSHSNGVFSPDVDLSSAMPKTPASLLVPAFPRDKMRFNDASPAAASPAAANAPNNFLDSFVQADEWEFLFADPSAHATTARGRWGILFDLFLRPGKVVPSFLAYTLKLVVWRTADTLGDSVTARYHE
ncbi:hypothetical protein B0J12DRAFT_287314 [Macrophomina phaseolina]|uniref:Uncharacterized protein n=1 Tax=Macrophomina phaseolina TaxID=35725 RepID=A0ABQ8GRF1_9PEZI|nr:hypothetical protein B0J12DRAFT_287314 [Macrophomina phaseolina]